MIYPLISTNSPLVLIARRTVPDAVGQEHAISLMCGENGGVVTEKSIRLNHLLDYPDNNGV